MSEIKHPFKHIKVIKKATDDEMSSAKELAHAPDMKKVDLHQKCR